MRKGHAVRVIVEEIDLDNEPGGVVIAFVDEWDALTLADHLTRRIASMDLAEVLGNPEQ